jgi:acyl-CoA synthetase (AMP-forming)/AMP-acid ligase II
MTGAKLDFSEVIAYLEPRLARYKIPKHLSVMEQLPRNGAGKLMKATLRAMLNPNQSAVP